MWTQISVHVTPVWNDALYLVTATWKDSDDAEPVVLVKEGTVAIGADSDVREIVRRVMDHLEPPQVV